MENLLKKLGLSDASGKIQVSTKMELQTLALTPEEGFLLSRIDALSTVEEIIKVSTFGREQTISMLNRFAEGNLIEPVLPSSPKTQKSPKEAAFSAVDPQLVADILKKFKEFREQKDLTSAQILGISPKATLKEAKNAYHKLTKKYHPDRLFRRGADELRKKVDFIFQRMNQALEDFEEIAGKKKKPIRKGRDGAVAPQRGMGVPVNVKERALSLLEEAKKKKGQDPVGALSTLKLALSFDPNHQGIQKLIKELEPRANLRKAVHLFEKAKDLDEMFAYEEAAKAYEGAANGDPLNCEIQRACGEFLLYKKKEPNQALQYVERALQLEPKQIENILLLGYNLKALKRFEESLQAFEKVSQLDRTNLFAKNEIAEIRKNLILSTKKR